MAGPDRHSMTEMHRSLNDATGANITAGYVATANGSGGITWAAGTGSGEVYYVPTAFTVAAIQTANDAAHAAGGGVVYCPAGTYTFGTALALSLDVSLLGAGRRATIFSATANSINLVQVTGVAMGGGTVPEIDTAQWIADIGFRANAHTGCEGIAYLGVAYHGLFRCEFRDFTIGAEDYGSLQSDFHDNKFRGCATGLKFDAQTIGYYGGVVPPNRVSVSWCSFLDNTSHAIDYSGGAQLIVDGSEFDACGTAADATTSAVYFHASPYNNQTMGGLTLRGCWFEGSLGLAAINLAVVTASHAQQHSITDTYFPTNDATYAVYVDGSVATNYLVTDRLLISSASSTRGIYRTGSGAVLDLRNSTGVLAGSGGIVTQTPLLDQTAVQDWSQMLALRLPNLTTTQRNAIAAPTAGMLIWNTTTTAFNEYTGSAWTTVGSVSPLTTKGDVWGYGSTDARVPVGPDGTVLTADSSATLGVSYQTPASISPQHVHVNTITYSGDGATTAFTLPAAPVDAYSAAAYVAGVRVDVTLSGTMLDVMTFSAAPASGTNNIVVDLVAALV